MDFSHVSDLTKIFLQIITPIITTILLFKPSIITLLTSSKTERLLMSKELRNLYTIVLFIVIFFLFPILVGIESPDDALSWFFNFTNNHFLTIMIINIALPIIYCFILFNKHIQNMVTTYKIALIIVVFLAEFYFLFTESVYSSIIHSLINDKLTRQNLALIIGYSIIHIIIVQPLVRFFLKTFKTKVSVTVRLTNGDIIKDIFLLHPTYGKKLVFGDNNDSSLCSETLIIPLEKIDYMHFFITHENGFIEQSESELDYKSKEVKIRVNSTSPGRRVKV